jgi:4-phytase / acid phosphatase
MNLRVVVFVLVLALPAGLSAAHAQIPPVPPGWQVERAVLLSRHGVRAPTESNEELDQHAATPWPAWPVPPGFLTPRGAELMRLMGAYYRVLYGGRGLVQADDCPPAGTVAAWSDVDQRTRVSGASLLAGMYPRCANLALRNQNDPSVPDPLFHPGPSPSCPMDAATNRAAILARIGGDFSSVMREYAPQLAAMQAVLCPTGVAAGGRRCGLPATPPALEMRPNGEVKMKGPFGLGGTAAEIFLMEAAEGWPKEQVAWGRLTNDAALINLLSIHRLTVDLTQKTVPVARQKGSNMLAQIVATLQDGHKFPGLAATAEPVRFALLVGHDTNISHIEGLLRLSWQIPGFQPNDATPGGALAFELFREISTGQRYVRLAYYAQTLQQMRQGTALSFNDPLGLQAVELPGCEPYVRDKACPLDRFVEVARAAIDPGCVSIKP